MNPKSQIDPPNPGGARPTTEQRDSGRMLVRLLHALEQRGASMASLASVAGVGILGYMHVPLTWPLVLVLLWVVFYEFQKRIDQGLPLMQIAALLGVLQWTVGPMLAYGTSLIEGRYSMYVDETSYFSYALPGTAAYVFGLLAVGSSVRQREMMRHIRREHFMVIGWVLNGIAFGAGLAASRVPSGLAFAVHLLSQIGYVGTIYFLYSGTRNRWLWVAISLLPLLKISADSAMFHDVLLWSGLFFCYWYGMRRHLPEAKAGLLVGVGCALFTIQAIKQDYRAKVWNGENTSLAGQAVSFWSNWDAVTSDETLANVISRLNQGWIISAVLNHVPSIEAFADGETIKDALLAALVPRFIMPDKKEAGGVKNFRRFTGLDLADDTSMGVSALGEAYVNFGREGGILFMLGFGLCFASFYTLCLQRAVCYPTFLFWIPLIFYQALKAETEFVTVLNQLSKGAVVAIGLHWLIDLPWISLAKHKPLANDARRQGNRRVNTERRTLNVEH